MLFPYDSITDAGYRHHDTEVNTLLSIYLLLFNNMDLLEKMDAEK